MAEAIAIDCGIPEIIAEVAKTTERPEYVEVTEIAEISETEKLSRIFLKLHNVMLKIPILLQNTHFLLKIPI